jgi:SAM-dependent methyltransferase
VVTLELLDKDRDGRYSPTAAGSVLSSRHPESVRPMVLHCVTLWKNWSHLTDSVREGKNPHRRSFAERGHDEIEAFIGAMHVVGRALATEVAEACGLDRFRRLLDVGGGSGTYTVAFLRVNPALEAVLFDLPEVIPLAERRLRAEGLLDRVRLHAGSFYEDELPTGCDVALLSAIIHQNGPAENVALFRKIHRALQPGGVLIIRDHVMEDDRTRPPAGAMFALNMLVSTDSGDTYSFAEIRRALAEAGFDQIRRPREGGPRMDSIVEARKPWSPAQPAAAGNRPEPEDENKP